MRFRWNRFFLLFAAEIRKRRIYRRSYLNWRWHLDEVFVKINGDPIICGALLITRGQVLEVFATKRWDRKAALKFLRRAIKGYGRPTAIVTDRLRSYRAAMNIIGNAAVQECGHWLTNRAENSHQPFRRRQRAMSKFRYIKTRQKFASIQASIHNHLNRDRHIKTAAKFSSTTSQQRRPVVSIGGIKSTSSAILVTGSH